MDPITGNLIGAGMGAIGKIASTPPAGPSNAIGRNDSSTSAGSTFDGSGWTVSTGSSKATGATVLPKLPTLAVWVGLAVVGVIVLRKLKKG